MEAVTSGLPEVARRRTPWCDESGETRARSIGCVVQVQRTPNTSSDALVGRWWQHHRLRRHVGERSCPACDCAGDGRFWRLRRGRRARLDSGDSGFRPAEAAIRWSLVPSPDDQHAVPQREWQHARCAGSSRRCWTFLTMFRVRSRAPGRPFGVSRVLVSEHTALRCETSRHASRAVGTWSLLFGRVGGDLPRRQRCG